MGLFYNFAEMNVQEAQDRRYEIAKELGLHPPSKARLLIAALRPITPKDICPPHKLEQLYFHFPDLRGDRGAVSWGDDGDCPSWVGHPTWWMDFFPRRQSLI